MKNYLARRKNVEHLCWILFDLNLYSQAINIDCSLIDVCFFPPAKAEKINKSTRNIFYLHSCSRSRLKLKTKIRVKLTKKNKLQTNNDYKRNETKRKNTYTDDKRKKGNKIKLQ